MKKHSIDIYALLFIAILFLITRLLSGCAASRDVQKDKTDVKTEEHIDQTRDNVTNSVTKTDESIVANTEVTETIDTLIRIPDPRTGLMINVPVHEKKVTKKQEYGTKKTENSDEITPILRQNSHLSNLGIFLVYRWLILIEDFNCFLGCS